MRFVRDEIVAPSGEEVKLDWHGHRDRGFGLANSLAAIEAGADRAHGTSLGIGERAGNTEMELLLINIRLLGAQCHDLRKLPEYSRLASRACGVPIPPDYPVVGEDAFRTGSGVHAAALTKARRKGDNQLADRVYSGMPAGDFGLTQRIEVSPFSGLSNVRHWLEEHGYDPTDAKLCSRVLEAAKRMHRVLRDDELESMVRAYAERRKVYAMPHQSIQDSPRGRHSSSR
jgi:2-isopropylmalate synthase